MAEYINLDTPLEAHRLRGNQYETISTTLREFLDFNKIPYTAADVQPARHGRWKFKEDKALVGNGKYWCSVCRYGFASGAYHKVDEFKFCPMCGAKMDGGEE